MERGWPESLLSASLKESESSFDWFDIPLFRVSCELDMFVLRGTFSHFEGRDSLSVDERVYHNR